MEPGDLDGKKVAVFIVDEEERDKDWRRVIGTLRMREGGIWIEETDVGPSFEVPEDLLDCLGPSDEEFREAAQGAHYLFFLPRERYLAEKIH